MLSYSLLFFLCYRLLRLKQYLLIFISSGFEESINAVKTLIYVLNGFCCIFFVTRKFLNFVYAQIWFFCGFFYSFWLSTHFSLIKRRQIPHSNSKIIKVTKNVITFQFRKWILIFRFLYRLLCLPINPVCLIWVIFHYFIINYAWNSRSSEDIFFSASLWSLILFHLSVVCVYHITSFEVRKN